MQKIVLSYILEILSLYHIGMDHYSHLLTLLVILSGQTVFLPGDHAKDGSLISSSNVVFLSHRNESLLYNIGMNHYSHQLPLLVILSGQAVFLPIIQQMVLSYLFEMLSFYHIGMDHYSQPLTSLLFGQEKYWPGSFLPGHHAKDGSYLLQMCPSTI